MEKLLFVLFTFAMAFLALSCNKDSINSDGEEILGTWISLDKSDTLDFVDRDSFYKSSQSMRYDHYNYHLEKDSIEIQYQGMLYVLVQPTKHKFELEGSNLIIDFSNIQCYGFSSQEIIYSKRK